MNEREETPHTTINIHAPVYGYVAGRDLSLPPSGFGQSEPTPTLGELQQALRQARAAQRRTKVELYLNWPCVVLLLSCTAPAAYMLWLVLNGRLLQIPTLPLPVMVGMAATVLLLRWKLERVRGPVRYVLADLRAEVHELERAVALRRAGRW